MRWAWIFALITVAQLCPCVFADDFRSRVEEHRRAFEQRRAEMRRQFEQRRASFGQTGPSSVSGAARGVQTYGSSINSRSTTGTGSTSSSRSYGSASVQQRTTTASPPSDRMKGTEFDPLPFDAKKAPSPVLCFLKFVATARTARTMDELLPFIPYAQQRVLKECQQQWDPQRAAHSKAAWMKSNPSMRESSADHLTEAPYTRELKHLNEIAAKVMRVRAFKITAANKAELDVATQSTLSTNAYGKWEDFPYGTAEVEMLGEGDYWRMKSYNDNNIHYKEPQ